MSDWSAAFEQSCLAWRCKFGLLDWAFRFTVEEGDDSKEARVDMDREARTAIFTSYTKGEHYDSPERTALHEVLHVVLNEMQELSALRGNHEHVDVAIEEHRAIERLLNVISP